MAVNNYGIPANPFAHNHQLGGGWKSTFMGHTHDVHWPYVYNSSRGFLYAGSDGQDIYWLKLQNNHWLWTRADIWPWAYNFTSEAWQEL